MSIRLARDTQGVRKAWHGGIRSELRRVHTIHTMILERSESAHTGHGSSAPEYGRPSFESPRSTQSVAGDECLTSP